MTAELSQDIESLCHARGLDVHTHPAHAIYLAWCVCEDRWGADSGPAKGALLDLVCEAWPECDISIHYCHQRDAPHAPVIEIRASDLSERDDHWEIWDADTVVAGMVAALEAAP